MLGLGFAIGVVEDKIENIMANKALNKDTKEVITDELNDIKDKFKSKSSEKLYNVKLIVDSINGSGQYLSTSNVKAIQNKNGYLGLMVDDEINTIKYYKESTIRSIEIWERKETQND